MMSVSNLPDWNLLKKRLNVSGQSHLLQWLYELNEKQQADLYNDIRDIDFDQLNKYFLNAKEVHITSAEKKDERLLPLDESICANVMRDKDKLDGWRDNGLGLISEGKVGVLLMAGGQGTRLGVQYPKGMYNVGLPSNKTLYQLQAERIVRLQELSKEKFGRETAIPWYIMTSEYTRDTTVEFFQANDYFGLNRTNVIIFEQDTIPSMDFNGKILLDQKHRIARSPDGNGGLYAALLKNNILDDMKSRGIECVHVYGVDNILVKMADPVFMGYCFERKADCGVKVVPKSSPNERVGVVCVLDGKYQVVEYSEITKATAEKCNPDGSLMFNAGNICNHYFLLTFLQSICSQHLEGLSHHIAKKKISFIDNKGQRIEPTEVNGMKMEKFVFDVFKYSKNFAVFAVCRDEEFSPLKNPPGAPSESPDTCKKDLMSFHHHQIVAAGGTIVGTDGKPLLFEGNKSSAVCEISPLVSYCGEGLTALCSGVTFNEPLHLQANN